MKVTIKYKGGRPPKDHTDVVESAEVHVMTAPLSAQEAVERIKGYCAARRRELEGVTAGPWEPTWDGTLGMSGFRGPKASHMTGSISRPSYYGNAGQEGAFIASSRSSVPAMVEALEAAVREWEKAAICDHAWRFHNGKDAMIIALASSLPGTPS